MPFDPETSPSSSQATSPSSAPTSGRKLLDDRDTIEHFRARRARGIKSCSPIWEQAKENHRFAAPGESQWPETAKKSADTAKAAALTFNEIHPIAQHLAGRQVLERFQRVYVPRNRDVAAWAEMVTDVDRAIVENCDAAQEESRAFYSGPCVGGVSWLSYEMDFLEDPEGQLLIRETPIWSVIWPADETRRMNLKDRQWHIVGFWLPKSTVRAKWPNTYKKLSETLHSHQGYFTDDSDRPSSRIPWRNVESLPDARLEFYDRTQDEFWVERYQFRTIEHTFKVMVPTDSAMTYEEAEGAIGRGELTPDTAYAVTPALDEDQFAELSSLYAEAHDGAEIPPAYVDETPAYSYKYALVCGDEVLEEGPIPVGRWTLLALTGYPFEQPDKVTWKSVVDALRDPQLWKNVFTSMLLRYLQVNPKGLLVYERGLFRNRNDAMNQWATMGGTVEVERGRLTGGRAPFEVLHGEGSPMGGVLESMVGMADQAIPRQAGFNPGMLGQVGPDLRRISGELITQLRESAVAAHAFLFDAFQLYRKEAGQLILSFIDEFYTEEDIIRVVGESQAYEEVVDPETGQKVSQSRIPPKEAWNLTNWKFSVQESSPAPDRLRSQFQSLSASGGLELLVESGVVTAEDLVWLIPDIPEHRREKMLARIKEAEGQGGAGAEGGAGGSQAQLQVIAEVLAELIQSVSQLPPERQQVLISALQQTPAPAPAQGAPQPPPPSMPPQQ